MNFEKFGHTVFVNSAHVIRKVKRYVSENENQMHLQSDK